MDYELRLRALEPADADMMYEAENDEAAWKYSDYLAPLSKELLHHYALTYDAEPFRSGQLRLIIELDETPIGILDLVEISPRHLRAEIGIYLLPEFRGKGLGREALLAAKDYCRNRLCLHQLGAMVADSNKTAKRSFNNAGFTTTGFRPEWLRTPNGYEGVEILSTLL